MVGRVLDEGKEVSVAIEKVSWVLVIVEERDNCYPREINEADRQQECGKKRGTHGLNSFLAFM